MSTASGSRAASDPTKSCTARIAEMFPTVMDEDRWALEIQQRMFEYPDHDYHEVYLRSDQALLRCLKVLAKLETGNIGYGNAPAQKAA